jgi:hypothetical protein
MTVEERGGRPAPWNPSTPPPPPPGRWTARRKGGVAAVVAAIAAAVAAGLVFAPNHTDHPVDASANGSATTGVAATNQTPTDQTPTSQAETANTTGTGAQVATPAGYVTFTDPSDGFSIAVPGSWRQVDPNSPTAQATIDELEKSNPNLQTALGSGVADLTAKGIKFLAIDPVVAGGIAPNVNVIAKPALGFGSKNLAQLKQALPGQYAQVGAQLQDLTVVTFAGRSALEAVLDLPLSGVGGSKLTAQETQYFVAANNYLYVVTLTGTSPDLDQVASTFEPTS